MTDIVDKIRKLCGFYSSIMPHLLEIIIIIIIRVWNGTGKMLSIFLSVQHFDLGLIDPVQFYVTVFLHETHLAQLNWLHNLESPVAPTPRKGFLSNIPRSLDNFRLTAVFIDPFSQSDSPCSISSPPSQFYSISPSVMWSWEALGAAAGAAVTGTADVLNWLPWGSPLGGAEEGTNCGGMLKRTRAHAGLV